MATKRKESSTGLYHVVVKGINNEKLFNYNREKAYFKEIISKHLEKYEVEIYSYCIMSNHAHFIIRAEIKVLSAFMAMILAEYAVYYNYKHHRNGHVFQNRFMSECIEDERYFWNCMRYIHLNPVKAKMVKKMSRYKYSSIREYSTEEISLLHSKAIKFCKKKFVNYEDFEMFHNERLRALFLDNDEDLQTQFKEIAIKIAEDMTVDNRLKTVNQVFEEKKYREEYVEKLRTELKIGVRRANQMCKDLYDEITSA